MPPEKEFQPEEAKGWEASQKVIEHLGITRDDFEIMKGCILNAAELIETAYNPRGKTNFEKRFNDAIAFANATLVEASSTGQSSLATIAKRALKGVSGSIIEEANARRIDNALKERQPLEFAYAVADVVGSNWPLEEMDNDYSLAVISALEEAFRNEEGWLRAKPPT